MRIEELHKICAMKKLAALPLLIPGPEMIVTLTATMRSVSPRLARRSPTRFGA